MTWKNARPTPTPAAGAITGYLAVSVINHDGGAPMARPVYCTLGWVDPGESAYRRELGCKIYGSGGLRSRCPPQFTHYMRKRRNVLC